MAFPGGLQVRTCTFTQEFASSPLLSVPLQPRDVQCPPVHSGLIYVPDQVSSLLSTPALQPLEGSISPLELLPSLL